MSLPWSGVPAKASEVRSRYESRLEAPPAESRTPHDYWDLLLRENRQDAAVEFLAHALPARSAAWWGSLCVWEAARPTSPPEADTALGAVVRWILKPDEEQRRAAGQAAASAEDEPAGFLAKAVYLSGGSLLPPELPVVSPPPFLAQRIITGAILMAATRTPAGRSEQLHVFLQWGADVAEGKNRWSRS
jgi:hypothetical protein